MSWIYKLRTILENWLPFPDIKSFAATSHPFLLASHLVRFYYVATFFLSIYIFQGWDTSLGNATAISPLWPLWWINFIPFPVAMYVIRGFFLTSSLFTAVYPERRLLRLMTFIGLLEFVSLYVSVWMADVDWYPWILVAFLLIFLPDGWGRDENYPTAEREKFLLVFWGCQAILLLTYSMSGLGKIIGSFSQILYGQVNSFAPEAVARHVASRIFITDSSTILGPWLIDHYWIAWPFFVAAIYLMLFSIFAAFRTILQRPWAIGLILYHLGAYLAMGISFFINIFLVSILLLYSPFQTNTTFKKTIRELPLIGWFINKFLQP